MRKITFLALLLATLSAVKAQVPAAGKIIHLEFDSNDPHGIFHDLSGHNPNATINGNSPTSVMGVSGNGSAIEFSGGTYLGYANGIYNQPSSANNNDYTFSTMVQINLGNCGIFGQGYSLANQCNSLKITNGNQITNYWWANDFAFNYSSSLQNAWHHITVSYNSSTQLRKIYVDGINTASSTQTVTTGPNWTANSPFYIGQTAGNEYFGGKMENFIGYNRALSDAEVLQLYNYSNCTGTATATQNATDFHSVDLTVNGMVAPMQIELVPASSLNDTLHATILAGNTINISDLNYDTHYIKITDTNGCVTSVLITLIRPITCTDNIFNTNTNLVFHAPFTGNANDVSTTGAAPFVNTGMLVNDKCGNPNSAYLLANGELKYDLNMYPGLKAGTNGKLTVTCWVNNLTTSFSSTYPTFVEIGDAAYLRYGAGSFFNAGVHNANTIPGSFGYADKAANSVPVHDQWHFYAFVYDMNINGTAGAVKVYIDNTEFYSGGNPNVLNLPVDYSIVGTTNHYLSIGGGSASGSNKKFYGAIDNVMIFNEALSASQIDDIRYGNEINPIGIKSVATDKKNIQLYPNPANNILNINLSEISAGSEDMSVEVINSLGQIIIKSTISSADVSIDISNLEQGIYFVRVSGTNILYTKTFIKQ